MIDEIYSFESMTTAGPIRPIEREKQNATDGGPVINNFTNSFNTQVLRNLAWLDRISRHAGLKLQGDITLKDFMAVYCLFQQAVLDEPKWNKSFRPDIRN